MSTRAHLELAAISRKYKDNKGLTKHLSAAIKIEPTASIEAYGELARIYHKSGKTTKAIKTIYNAIDVFPEDKTAQAHAYLAFLLSTQSKYEQALKELKLALRIKPDYAKDELFQENLKKIKEKAKP